jgi:glycerophosphoryl diester phosphodiesterase
MAEIRLIAHRLGREPGPDSSRVALASTLASRVDGLETDVCLTADGRLALLHDPWLSNGTTASGWAHQTPWDELRDVRLLDRQGAPTTETPMLLEELLERVPAGVRIQLEVKAHGDPDLARTTAAAACAIVQDRADVEVISFYTAACEEAARLGQPARLVTWADYEPDALIRWATRAGVGGICVEHFLLRRELVARLKLGGLSVSTGTINDAELAIRSIGLGVDAITTDRPGELRRQLAALTLAA